jgi:hypothetical protein
MEIFIVPPILCFQDKSFSEVAKCTPVIQGFEDVRALGDAVLAMARSGTPKTIYTNSSDERNFWN